MSDFVTMQNRIATELRRSNLSTEIKAAINDAIKEAAATRFYFNEMKGVTFDTADGTEYYDDQDIVEVDSMYYFVGSTRYNIVVINNDLANTLAEGSVSGGQLEYFSRYGQQFRLYPVPSSIVTVYVDGFGRLTPYPLVNDADTSAWMTEGEQYIRALAKSYLLRDVIRDVGEATTYEALAADRKSDLLSQSGLRQGTGRVRPTRF